MNVLSCQSRFTLLWFHSLLVSAIDINLSCFISAAPVRQVNAATNIHHASVVVCHAIMSMMSLSQRAFPHSTAPFPYVRISPLGAGGINQVAAPTMCKCVGTSRLLLPIFPWGLTCVLQFMLVEFILHFNCKTVRQRFSNASQPLVLTLIVRWHLYYFSGTVLSNSSSPGPYVRDSWPRKA